MRSAAGARKPKPKVAEAKSVSAFDLYNRNELFNLEQMQTISLDFLREQLYSVDNRISNEGGNLQIIVRYSQGSQRGENIVCMLA